MTLRPDSYCVDSVGAIRPCGTQITPPATKVADSLTDYQTFLQSFFEG